MPDHVVGFQSSHPSSSSNIQPTVDAGFIKFCLIMSGLLKGSDRAGGDMLKAFWLTVLTSEDRAQFRDGDKNQAEVTPTQLVDLVKTKVTSFENIVNARAFLLFRAQARGAQQRTRGVPTDDYAIAAGWARAPPQIKQLFYHAATKGLAGSKDPKLLQMPSSHLDAAVPSSVNPTAMAPGPSTSGMIPHIPQRSGSAPHLQQPDTIAAGHVGSPFQWNPAARPQSAMTFPTNVAMMHFPSGMPPALGVQRSATATPALRPNHPRSRPPSTRPGSVNLGYPTNMPGMMGPTGMLQPLMPPQYPVPRMMQSPQNQQAGRQVKPLPKRPAKTPNPHRLDTPFATTPLVNTYPNPQAANKLPYSTASKMMQVPQGGARSPRQSRAQPISNVPLESSSSSIPLATGTWTDASPLDLERERAYGSAIEKCRDLDLEGIQRDILDLALATARDFYDFLLISQLAEALRERCAGCQEKEACTDCKREKRAARKGKRKGALCKKEHCSNDLHTTLPEQELLADPEEPNNSSLVCVSPEDAERILADNRRECLDRWLPVNLELLDFSKGMDFKAYLYGSTPAPSLDENSLDYLLRVELFNQLK